MTGWVHLGHNGWGERQGGAECLSGWGRGLGKRRGLLLQWRGGDRALGTRSGHWGRCAHFGQGQAGVRG